MKYDREYVLALLQVNECEVVFVKVDGQNRSMRATLRPDLLPKLPEKSLDTIQRALPADVVRCYDLDKNEWRSFRMDRLIDISIYANDREPAVVINTVSEEVVNDDPFTFFNPIVGGVVIPSDVDPPFVSGGGGTFDGGGASAQYDAPQQSSDPDPSPSYDSGSSDSGSSSNDDSNDSN